MAWGRKDERGPLERAVEAAGGLKGGGWAGVEALAVLAIELRGRPEAGELHERARREAAGLGAGTWESVRALAWLARAGRELGAG